MLSLCRERYSSVTLSHGFNFDREIVNAAQSKHGFNFDRELSQAAQGKGFNLDREIANAAQSKHAFNFDRELPKAAQGKHAFNFDRELPTAVQSKHPFNFDRELPQAAQGQGKDSNTRRYHKRSITANVGNYAHSRDPGSGPDGDADSINLSPPRGQRKFSENGETGNSQKSLVGGSGRGGVVRGGAEGFEAKSTRRNNFFQTKSQEINRARRKGSFGVKVSVQEGSKMYQSIPKVQEGGNPRRGSREFESMNNVNIKNYVKGVKAKMGDGVSKTKVNFLRQKRFLN